MKRGKNGFSLLRFGALAVLAPMFALVFALLFSADAFANVAVISGDAVNVRSEAGTDASVIKQYNTGDAIDIVSYENGWYKVAESASASGFAYVTAQFVNLVEIDAIVNEDRVNIREGGSTDTKVLGVLNKGDKISITGSEGDFYLFNMGGLTGYIYKSYADGAFLGSVQEQEKVSVIKLSVSQPAAVAAAAVTGAFYGVVTSDEGVNFRTGPSQSSEAIFALPYGDVVDVIEAGGAWHRVSYAGVEGYIIADYLEVRQGAKPDVSARSQKAGAVINFARKYIGTPYVWGGTNLSRGVDCSGFIYSVLRNFGYSMSRSSRDQFRDGTRVARADLLPGDLVFFDTNLAGTISHVGMYIGDGQFIHSCSGSRTMAVTINGLWENYYSARYYGACRIIY